MMNIERIETNVLRSIENLSLYSHEEKYSACMYEESFKSITGIHIGDFRHKILESRSLQNSIHYLFLIMIIIPL